MSAGALILNVNFTVTLLRESELRRATTKKRPVVVLSNKADDLPLRALADSFLNSYGSKAKENDLDIFLQWLCCETGKTTNGISVSDLSAETLRAFADHSLDTRSQATTYRRLATLRHFLARSRSPYLEALARSTPKVRPPRAKFAGHTVEQVAKVRAYAGSDVKDTFLRHRIKLEIELLYGTGMRRAEIVGLNRGQLINYFKSIEGVKRKCRVVSDVVILPNVKPALMSYLPVWETEIARTFKSFSSLPLERQSEYPLLIKQKGVTRLKPETYRITPETLYRDFKHVCKLAGVEPSHPHIARHTHARHVLAGLTHLSAPEAIVALAQQLGHTQLNTTLIYAQRDDSPLLGIDLNAAPIFDDKPIEHLFEADDEENPEQ